MALPQNIIDAQSQSQALATKAGEFATALPTISDELKKRVDTLFNENQDVLGLFNQGITDLVAAPGKSYDMFSNVTDPYARERLSSQFVQTQSLPALTAAGQLGQRMGTIGDIVGQNTRAFQAQATAANTAAELARQKYQDVLQQFQIEEDMRIQQEQLALQRQAAARSGAPSYGERQDTEIRKLIAEAGKLPEAQRSAYIISNGYNPADGNFSGLFSAKIDEKKAVEIKKIESDIAKNKREADAAKAKAEKDKKAEWQIWNPFSWFD